MWIRKNPLGTLLNKKIPFTHINKKEVQNILNMMPMSYIIMWFLQAEAHDRKWSYDAESEKSSDSED